MKVKLQSFKKTSYKRSFKYRAAIAWNQLSNSCKETLTIASFKKMYEKEQMSNKITFRDGGIGNNINMPDFEYY